MILTLPLIFGRCDEVGPCWLWRHGSDSNGVPNARDGAKTVTVRRRVWELHHGMPVGRGWFVISTCTNKRCVGPECAKRLTGPQYQAWLNSIGRLNGVAHRAAKIAAVRARADTKLTMEKAQTIRARIDAGDDRGEVAAEFGISRCHANRVARGVGWRDESFSVFNQLVMA